MNKDNLREEPTYEIISDEVSVYNTEGKRIAVFPGGKVTFVEKEAEEVGPPVLKEFLPEKLQYLTSEIKALMQEIEHSEVPMSGLHSDFISTKAELEALYEKYIWHFGMGLMDAPYHGWEGAKLENMQSIVEEVEETFLRLYTLILIGIGGKKWD